MRRLALIAVVLVAAGCGESERENDLRPAVPVLMTASIADDVVRVTPRGVGAGQVTLVVSNQTDAPQTVTFETDEVGGRGGNRASSRQIAPSGTGRLTINAREGTYAVRTGDEAIRAARIQIGPPRKSGQDRVLLP